MNKNKNENKNKKKKKKKKKNCFFGNKKTLEKPQGADNLADNNI